MNGDKDINILQKVYTSLKDDNGIWRKEPVGIISNAETSEKNVETLRLILDIILGSDKIADEVKLFISSESTIKEINDEINRRIELRSIVNKKKTSPYSYSNTCKKITDASTNFSAILGIGMIRKLIYNRVEDTDNIDKKIEKFMLSYGNSNGLRNNLAIDIDTDEIGVSAYKNNEDFFDILQTVENYLVQRKAIIQRALNNDKHFVKYFNYLLNSASLSDESVRQDRERLLKFLNNEDYKTGYVDNEDGADIDDEDIDAIVDELTNKVSNPDVKVEDTVEIKNEVENDINKSTSYENGAPENPVDNTNEDDAKPENEDGDTSEAEIDLEELLSS